MSNSNNSNQAILCGLSTTATPLGGLTDSKLKDSVLSLVNDHKGKVIPLLLDYCSLYSLPAFEEICTELSVKGLVGTKICLQHEGKMLGELVFVARNQTGLQEIVNLVTQVNGHKHNIDKIKFTKSDLSLGQWVYNTMLPEDILTLSKNVNVFVSPTTPRLSDLMPDVVKNHIFSITGQDIQLAHSLEDGFFGSSNSIYLHTVANTASSKVDLFEGVLKLNDNLPEWELKEGVYRNRNLAYLNSYISSNNLNEQMLSSASALFDNVQNISVLEKEHLPEADFGIDIITESRALLEEKLRQHPELDKTTYYNYLEKEIGILKAIGGEGYYETIIAFARFLKNKVENGGIDDLCLIRVRGSASASLMLHLFGVTSDLNDPVQHGLTIERFITPFRVEFPDIDIDIPTDQRHLFVEFMELHYGKGTIVGFVNRNQQSSLSSLLGKVSRFHFGSKLPADWSGKINTLCKNVQAELLAMGVDPEDRSFFTAIQRSKLLANAAKSNEDLNTVLEITKDYAELTSTYTSHQSGMILSPTGEFKVPTKVTASGGRALESKKPSKLGYVKFDILSSKNVQFIREATKLLKKQYGIDYQVPTSFDSGFFEFMENNNAFLNQMGGEYAKKTLQRFKPRSSSELLDSLAIPRPVLSYQDREEFYNRRGKGLDRNNVLYSDQRVLDILKPTNGFVLFDEQILRLAFDVVGYDGGQADKLRTVIKKGNIDGFMSMHDSFMAGVNLNGGNNKLAEELFNLLEKSVGRYAYPKAHAQSYAAIAMEQAWFKLNYPDVALSAIMSTYDDKLQASPAKGVDKTPLDRLMDEYRARGFVMAPPSISFSSKETFRISDRNGTKVIYAPLMSIFKKSKGAEAQVMLDIIGKLRSKGLTTNITLKSFIDLTASYFSKTMRKDHNVLLHSDVVELYKEMVNQLVYFGAFDDTGFSMASPAAETRLEAREKLLSVSQLYIEDALSEIRTCKGKFMMVSLNIDPEELKKEERKLYKTDYLMTPMLTKKEHEHTNDNKTTNAPDTNRSPTYSKPSLR